MDATENYRQLIRKILAEHMQIPYAQGDAQIEPVFDREDDLYLLVAVGRENGRRVYRCLAHIDIIHGKLRIQYDGTERGLAKELVRAGVPKDDIILGFCSPESREPAGFAAA